MTLSSLPFAVIGAGPVGLAAAAHFLARGLRPLVLEAGDAPAAAVRAWGHVRMFSPWRFNTDAAAVALLRERGWAAPDPEDYPTGAELVARYLAPLAAHPAIAPRIRLNARVVGVSRRHHDLQRDGMRADAPFVLQLASPSGGVEEVEAAAVLDCSGTWGSPNPVGAHGLPAPGEPGRVVHGIPDVLAADRQTYAGRRTLVVGAGHSAMNLVEALAALALEAPGTDVTWAFRRPLGAANFGGGANDGLAARGALGARAHALVAAGRVHALAPFLVTRLSEASAGGALRAEGLLEGRPHAVEVDRVVGATGFRPDLSFLSELRLSLDPAVQATPALAPLIDPNLHSCGTVRPHGEAELRHPAEPGFYVAGMKAYGRAPTFLMTTGHEQARSIVAHLAGDDAAARRVELILPETGVCSGPARARVAVKAAAASSCCTPAPAATAEAPATAQGSCCPPKVEQLPADAPCRA